MTLDQGDIGKKEKKISRTPEGRILWAGVGLSGTLILVILYYLVVDYKTAETLFLAFLAHTFGGRAAGIGLCIIGKFSVFWTIVYNFYLEVLIVCFAYAVFILSLNNYIKFRWVTRYTVKAMHNAATHKDKVEKYGWIGLFLFVMAPLPVTGPVMGSIIGYLLRMSVLRNFSAIFPGTLAAIVVWVLCFDFLEQHLHIIQYVIMGIIGIVILSHLKRIIAYIKK